MANLTTRTKIGTNLTPKGSSLSTAEMDNNLDALNVDLAGKPNKGTPNTFSKTQSITPVALGTTGSIAVDATLSNAYYTTLTGNAVLAAPTGLVEGTTFLIKIKQNAAAAYTLGYDPAYIFLDSSGTDPTISTTLGSINLLSCAYIDGTLICQLGIKAI